MFLGGKKPPPTVIRKVAVPVKKDDSEPPVLSSGPAHRSPAFKPGNILKRFGRKASRSSNYEVRRTSSPVSSASSAISKAPRSHTSLAPRKGVKRKQPSPSVQYPNFSSDESEDDDVSTKRLRSSSGEFSAGPGAELEDDNREVITVSAWTKEDDNKWPIINGAAIVSGEYAKEYKSDIFGPDAVTTNVKLQYPSNCPPEIFRLVTAKERQGIDPISEVTQSVEMMCKYYFPEDISEKLSDDNSGIVRQLKRAFRDGSLEQFSSVLKDFNATVKDALSNGSLANTVGHIRSAPLPLVESILNQIYTRTVSPRVHMLKQYENGTSNVYGELLPRFSHLIFQETKLRSDHVFIDLGSGVGNVSLQAALEIGCESWGIEQMPNPAALGRRQVKEFRARCKRWSINHGRIRLLEGDFLASPEIDAAIRRADVILINNQAFTPELNDQILMKLLDVKEGGRIVSLKSFVPAGWEIKKRSLEDPRNVLRVVKKQYWSNSVSWTGGGGDYYIATIDPSRLRQFQENM